MTLNVYQEQVALQEVVAWIDQHVANIQLPTDERSLLAQGCLDVAIEHQAAILLLHKAQLYGSLFALLRVIGEALVRGLWFKDCATESEIANFKRRWFEKTFGTLIAEIEARPGHVGTALSAMKRTGWTALNDFTHTGFAQVSRRHAPGVVGASYPDHEVRKALSFAGAVGLIAAGALIEMTDNTDLGLAAIERFKQYANPVG